jgi:hypothetical protein
VVCPLLHSWASDGDPTNRELELRLASKTFSKGKFGEFHRLCHTNRVHAAARFPPLIVSGLKVGNVAFPDKLCHAALDGLACKWHMFKFLRLRPTGTIFESNIFYSHMEDRPDEKSSTVTILKVESVPKLGACLVLSDLARTKFGILGLRRSDARA